MVEKLYISAIYKSIILIFQWIILWYLSTSIIKKFKSNHQENPREQHLGEVRQGTLKLKIDISNHRNFSMNLPIVFILLFNFFFLIQTPGDPREHRLGEVLHVTRKVEIQM